MAIKHRATGSAYSLLLREALAVLTWHLHRSTARGLGMTDDESGQRQDGEKTVNEEREEHCAELVQHIRAMLAEGCANHSE